MEREIDSDNDLISLLIKSMPRKKFIGYERIWTTFIHKILLILEFILNWGKWMQWISWVNYRQHTEYTKRKEGRILVRERERESDSYIAQVYMQMTVVSWHQDEGWNTTMKIITIIIHLHFTNNSIKCLSNKYLYLFGSV